MAVEVVAAVEAGVVGVAVVETTTEAIINETRSITVDQTVIKTLK